MPYAHPTWKDKTDKILEALCWASKLEGAWANTKEAFRLREPNAEAWFEIRVRALREIGIDETIQRDLESTGSKLQPGVDDPAPPGSLENPRQEEQCGQRQLTLDVRFFSGDTEHDSVAWVHADQTRARLRTSYVRNEFLRPVAVSIDTMFDVFALPTVSTPETDDREESEASLELILATTIREIDEAAVGTWIESVQVTSNLKQPGGGSSLDSSLQLDNTEMP